jgi:transmembrane sensor
MSELRAPLRQALEDPASEQELRRVWGLIQHRRAQARARRDVRTFARWGALGLAVAVVALVAVVVLRAPSRFISRAPGPLLVGTAAPAVLVARQGGVSLSDGSHIDLAPSARLEVVDNSGRAFVSVLHAGRATFEVRPDGPRRWTIEAGLASVEVVGTRFSVTREPTSVEVAVEHGIVLVRGERVPDRIQRLTAGQRLRVSAPDPTPALTSVRPDGLPDPVPAGVDGVPSAVPDRGTPVRSASAALGFDALLGRADAERRAGNLRAAEATLDAAVAAAPDRGRAALAAFTLGKLLLDGSGRPADAARAFSRAVTLGPPAAIAEDALARLVEAEGRAGHIERARTAARQYAARYPNGPKLYAVNRWLERR